MYLRLRVNELVKESIVTISSLLETDLVLKIWKPINHSIVIFASLSS